MDDNSYSLIPLSEGGLADLAAGVKRVMSLMVEDTLKIAKEVAIARVDLDALVIAGKKIYSRERWTDENWSAIELFRRAAEAGHDEAQYLMFWCLEHSHRLSGTDEGPAKGVGQTEACNWLLMSAKSGFAKAQEALAWRLHTGKGFAEDNVESAKWFEKAAEQGSASAQNSLARCYSLGHGVERDDSKAFEWMQKAAEGGDKEAQWSLGRYYRQGRLVGEDYAEAAKWFRKSAEQGYPVAQDHIGHCYEVGRGVARDAVEAAKWYSRAAASGYRGGVISFARCNIDGIGIAQNLTAGVKVLRDLAGQQDPAARYHLALCYLHGKGVSKDELEAYRLLQLSTLQGHERAAEELISLFSNMPQEQRARCERRYGKIKLGRFSRNKT